MRALSPAERHALLLLAQHQGGELIPLEGHSDGETMVALVTRGCASQHTIELENGTGTVWYITSLGRLALRVSGVFP